MITIGVPAEGPDEPRIGLSPETAKKLVKLGAKVRSARAPGFARISPTKSTKTPAPRSSGPTPTR